MSVTDETKRVIIDAYRKLPMDKAKEFGVRIKNRLKDLDADPVIGYALAGACIGAIIEIVPGMETITGIDDGVASGAAIGGLIGFVKSRNQRDTETKIRNLIREELNDVLSH